MLNPNFNLFKIIKRKIFPFYKNNEIKLIFSILQKDFSKETITARFVGGCVRKYISGEKIDDIDIATILTTDQIKERFKNTDYKVVDTGVEHGTVTLFSKNFKIEITTLRKDVKTDGRHAEIEYTDDWRIDSERRDFTINAIYLDINGKIFDPQMGVKDFENNNIKFIGDPQKRIEEDYLRIIRFIRFKLMYNIEIEPAILKMIKQNLDGIKKISKERIILELFKILDLKNFFKINENNQLKEIFTMIFPEFLYLNRLERLKKVYDFSQINRDTLLAILLIDQKNNHDYFVHKYNVSNKINKILKNLSSNYIEIEKNKNFLGKDLLKNIHFLGKSHLIALNLINFTVNKNTKLVDFNKTFKRILGSNVPKFHIDGDYLKKNGVKEGETLGKLLKVIENEWIKNNFKISNEKIKELIKENVN